MGKPSQPPCSRDGQARSGFTSILEALVASCDGALASGLVDFEGESVDVASAPVVTPRGVAPSVPSERIKLASAHWQIVMREATGRPALGAARQLWVDATNGGYLVQALEHGYALVLVCRAGAIWSASRRALRQAEVELCHEAGWPVPRVREMCWTRVRVSLGARGEPTVARAGARVSVPLRVLEPLADLRPFERGWRVTDGAGRELELVREPGGVWFLGHQGALAGYVLDR